MFNFQRPSHHINESDLDDLVSWVVLLGQDPKIMSSALQITITNTIGHALELYQNFSVSLPIRNFLNYIIYKLGVGVPFMGKLGVPAPAR